MALNEDIPIDGDGATTGTLVSQICGSIRTLRTTLNDGGLDDIYYTETEIDAVIAAARAYAVGIAFALS